MTAAGTEAGAGNRRPGGRTAQTRDAVMRATLDEMGEHGYAGTTVERVAVRAGVAKTTIYRRWGSLDGVLADLMADQAAQGIPVPDEGNLAADLQVLARAVVGSLSDPAVRGAFASMLVAAIQQPAARGVFDRFLDGRVARMTVIIDRAAARGEVPPDTDGSEILRTLAALLYSRLFLIGEPASLALADNAAAMVAATAREHHGSTRGAGGS